MPRHGKYRAPALPEQPAYTPRPGSRAEQVMHLLYGGVSPGDAAELIGVSPQAVYDVRDRLLGRFVDDRRRDDDNPA